MEPNILAIGRLQSTLDILVEEWEKFGRNVTATNSLPRVKEAVASGKIDLVVIGGGLPDDQRAAIKGMIQELDENLEVHPIPRANAKGPVDFLTFVNNLVINYKVRQAMKQQSSR